MHSLHVLAIIFNLLALSLSSYSRGLSQGRQELFITFLWHVGQEIDCVAAMVIILNERMTQLICVPDELVLLVFQVGLADQEVVQHTHQPHEVSFFFLRLASNYYIR